MKKVLIALLFSSLAYAGETKESKAPAPPAQPAQPAPPPEVKATVDAFKGSWTFDSTLTGVPGMDKPAKFKMSMSCKPVAGGNAVSCDGKAKTAMGPWDAAFLIAYDPYSKAVHFISVTNEFEVHDHVCQWKGQDLTCTPLKAGMGPGGDEISEDITMKFDKNTLAFTSVSHGKGGMTVSFEGKGKK